MNGLPRTLEIVEIDVHDRLRPVEANIVSMLAASIAEEGQLQPIIVRADPASNRAVLVAGAHRLAALKELGRDTVQCIMINADAEQARLYEIDENLVRRELSPLDRAIFLAERKKAYIAVHPEMQRGKAPKSFKEREKRKTPDIGVFQSFAKDAAKKTGLSKSSIDAAVKLVERLNPEALHQLRLTPLADNAAQLAALSRLPALDQIAVATAVKDRGLATLAAAKAAAGITIPAEKRDPEQAALERIFKDLGVLGAKSLDLVNAKVQELLRPKRRSRADAA